MRKKTATVYYLMAKVWRISVRSSDGRLLADLVGALGAAEKRGLQVNEMPPFGVIESEPQKVRTRKVDLMPRFVGGISDGSPSQTKKPEMADVGRGPGRETGG